MSKCSGGNILFAGGVNNQLRTFIYNLKLNVLYINPSKDESIILNERTFYKIDHNFNIAIPKNIEKDHIIALANKNSKTLNLVPFELIGIKARNNLLRFDNPSNRLPGNVIIQCRYMSLKDYENFLKHKEMQLNNKTKGGFDIYNRKEQGKKLGDKLNPDPYRYQYRGKTPLALERINEGKSDEENEDDNAGKNKSSSAKKQKRALDLGLKIENIGKYNFITEKREGEKEDNESNNNENKKDNKQENKEFSKDKEPIISQKNRIINSSCNLTNKKEKPKEIKVDDEDNEHNCHSDLEPEEIYNHQNTHTEIKQKIKDKNANSNNKENKKENNANEILSNDNKQEIKKIYNLKTDKELNKSTKELRHKKLNNVLNKKEEGKNNESNKAKELSSLTDKNHITKNYYNSQIDNRNINININMNDIFKLKNDTKDINNNRVNNNININLNNNFNKININTNDNQENSRMEIRKKFTSSNSNSKDNIHPRSQIQNRNISSSANNINNINNEQQKKMNISKNMNSNTIQNLKDKDNNPVIHKLSTAFISSMISQKNYQNLDNRTNTKNINNNPFIDNSKYYNIGEKESYHLKDEAEPNINRILTNKNAKTIKEIKKSQKMKNYKTNTVTYMPINTDNILSGSNPNYNNINQNNQNNNIEITNKNINLSDNIKISSYKASTHNLYKGKPNTPLNNNNNNRNANNPSNKIKISGNNVENLNYSSIPLNKKIFKSNISPEQKRVNSQKFHYIQTEGNSKREMYMKNRHNYETQRLNTTNNIINNNSGNNIGNNSVRLLKSDIGLNEQIMKGSKNAFVIKDGKRYVLAKNVQRIRREEEDGMFRKIEERKKIYNSTNFIDNNH